MAPITNYEIKVARLNTQLGPIPVLWGEADFTPDGYRRVEVPADLVEKCLTAWTRFPLACSVVLDSTTWNSFMSSLDLTSVWQAGNLYFTQRKRTSGDVTDLSIKLSGYSSYETFAHARHTRWDQATGNEANIGLILVERISGKVYMVPSICGASNFNGGFTTSAGVFCSVFSGTYYTPQTYTGYVYLISDTSSDVDHDIIADPDDTDPYNPGGDTGDDDTEGEGGTGDFDGTTDPIDFPDLPTLSAVDTKFVTIFNPTTAQLTSLAEYMWSPLFDLDTLKKLWADPMDCILGLTMVPFSVPNGGTGTVAIGNVSTGISMTKAGSQYVSIDCGSINVKEFWGGYLDYDPYTKFQIYLPYVGIKPLLADEIMGKSIHVKYHCDILTGACNCFVKCGGSVLYSFNGQCSTQIPISGNDWRNTISAAINIAGQAAGMYVTGGSSAPMAISSIAQSAVNGLKQTVEKSGSLSGTGGMLAIQKPYLIATRPKQAVPKNQNKFTGYPAFITRTLSSCEGYTEVYSCHLENIPCTADELNEIENLLKAGVIL
jgi:hypothetical protein